MEAGDTIESTKGEGDVDDPNNDELEGSVCGKLLGGRISNGGGVGVTTAEFFKSKLLAKVVVMAGVDCSRLLDEFVCGGMVSGIMRGT